MNRFVHIDYPTQHPGVARIERAATMFGRTQLFRSIVAGLSLIGAPVRRAVGDWAAARHQASEDRKLWDVALTDARVMADLSRAMGTDAQRDLKTYY